MHWLFNKQLSEVHFTKIKRLFTKVWTESEKTSTVQCIVSFTCLQIYIFPLTHLYCHVHLQTYAHTPTHTQALTYMRTHINLKLFHAVIFTDYDSAINIVSVTVLYIFCEPLLNNFKDISYTVSKIHWIKAVNSLIKLILEFSD